MRGSSKILALFATMAVVLLASIQGTYWMGQMTLNKSRLVRDHQAVIDQVTETLSTLKDAETGQRGYLITSDERYLEPYRSAVVRIQADLAGLADSAQAGKLDAGSVATLRDLAEQKLRELEKTIALGRSGPPGAAVTEVKSHLGKHLMDSIRAQARQLLDQKQREMVEARRVAERYTMARTIVFIVVAFGNLGFLAWTYMRIKREMTARMAASDETQRQKDLLQVTLSSIGDAVIVTDTTSRITFLNHVAEHLTGWSAAEAIGRRCAEVFRIINESSREVVESPVDKVLQHGNIVGLANHTLLIRKDGSEVPIDDSGAPIRETDGAVRGVVLIFRDFSEHKKVERELLAAKENLEAASRAKDQFLATLSHELRTPLTPVLATLTTWESAGDLPAPLLSDVQMLRRNVELEARLIDDLLDLTRIVKGKLSLNREVVDVHELIHSVAGMYQSEIQSKQLHLTMRLDAERHNADVDPARFQQVCWNILKNATKFTPESGTIDILTRNDGDDGQLSVTFTDSGIGMSPGTLTRLFRPFEQGTADTVRRFGGLGLGMAISKALVDAHQGSLTAASDGEGLGSAFTVTLPISMRALSGPTNASATPKAPGSTRPLRILLVEDHPDTARVMARLLRRLGHQVEPTDSVAAATRAVEDHSFDLILSDIGLPDGTGIELMRHIRQHHKTPAIALTGFGMDDDIAMCRDAGFDAHLTKPINFQKLEMLIHQLANNGEQAANAMPETSS